MNIDLHKHASFSCSYSPKIRNCIDTWYKKKHRVKKKKKKIEMDKEIIDSFVSMVTSYMVRSSLYIGAPFISSMLLLTCTIHHLWLCDMNHDQEIFIPQGPITRTRAKKLQQTLYSYIQAMVSSSKKILEDVGDLPYMWCKVEVQERDELNAL